MAHASRPPANRARSLGIPLALAAALLLFRAAPAGEEAYRPITPAGVRAGDFRFGEKRKVIGKYQELINKELKLYDFPSRFLVGSPQLARKLLDLKTDKENIALLGHFREPEPVIGPDAGLPVFEVEHVEAAPTDVELYEAGLRALLDDPRRSVERLLGLAGEISSTLRKFPSPALAPLARRAYAEAYNLADLTLPREDSDGRLSLIRRIHQSLGEVDLTVDLLKSQARRFPDHGPTRVFLSELRCTQMKGEWLTYPEFKRKLGFVLRANRWVKPAQKELLDLVHDLGKEREVRTNLILRTRTDREYLLLARSGSVERGMNRSELSEALGLPDRVERKMGAGFEVDQWNYGDRRVYFLNGQVIATAP